MNKERILALADLIEKQPHTTVEAPSGFSMENWSHDCGTPACIAGWAWAMEKAKMEDVDDNASDAAQKFLGLGVLTGDSLFEPDLRDTDLALNHHWENHTDLWGHITPTHAAAVLRHLADTGKVDWSVGQ